MSGSLEIRGAVAGDAGAISRIHAQGISERVATFETSPPSAADVRRLISSGAVVVAELTLYVDQAARREGVGRGLLDALAREAKRRGYWKLVGKVFASNLASLELLRARAGERSACTADMAGWTASGRT